MYLVMQSWTAGKNSALVAISSSSSEKTKLGHMVVSMITMHWGTFDIGYFQNQMSSQTFRSTLLGV